MHNKTIKQRKHYYVVLFIVQQESIQARHVFNQRNKTFKLFSTCNEINIQKLANYLRRIFFIM